MTTQSTEPATVRAGDSVAWRRVFPDYPPTDGWTLKYRLVSPAAVIDLTASADGDGYLVTAAPAQTTTWLAGEYAWVAYVEKTGERHTLLDGRMTIQPDLAALSAGYDTRSLARKTLESLRQALADYVASNGHVSEYEIGGAINRRMRFRSAAEIEALIRFWSREVAKEEQAARLAAGLPAGNTILVRL